MSQENVSAACVSRTIGLSPTAAIVAIKRLAAVTALTAVSVLGAPGSTLAATASPISPSNLNFPAGFAVTPNGARIIYGERSTGRIRSLNTGTGATSTLFTVPSVSHTGEQGLLGVALSRRFPDDARIWAYVTRTVSGGGGKNQLIRIRADRSGFKVIRSLPTFLAHNGGHIAFGPDGKLYVVVGENGFPALAQDLTSLAGKMLRLNPDGTVPSDNPRPASPIIAYGIRNSFGFTFDPKSGRIWETENGPECNDEVNLLNRTRLQNLGWGPSASCSTPPQAPHNTNQDGPNPVMPKRYFANPPALVGAAFCRRCGLSSSGQLFFGSFNTGTIRRAKLGSARLRIVSQAPFYDHPNSVLSLETPVNGGPIYFSTQFNIYRLDP